MFGKVFGRFFVEQNLGIREDDTLDTCTLSELLETYEHWEEIVKQLSLNFKTKQLFTMFETSDVHPDIIKAMKVFDRVIVPYEYLKNILQRHEIKATSLDFYTSELIRMRPHVIPKVKVCEKLVFLYVGTNDIRKNITSLTRVFARVSKGTPHVLIVKTNTKVGLTESPNIVFKTDKVSNEQLAGLYNVCDYVISFTRGEGVGLPMLEASYFNKPIISHDKGVFEDVKKFTRVPWYVLPSREVEIDYRGVPDFLKKVFYKSWWEVDEEGASRVLLDIFTNNTDQTFRFE
jgi:glycosyltransferase involved in cell wall biosynthesis